MHVSFSNNTLGHLWADIELFRVEKFLVNCHPGLLASTKVKPHIFSHHFSFSNSLKSFSLYLQLSFSKSEKHLLTLVDEVAFSLGSRSAAKTLYIVDMETAVSSPNILDYSDHM